MMIEYHIRLYEKIINLIIHHLSNVFKICCSRNLAHKISGVAVEDLKFHYPSTTSLQ